MNSDLSVLLYFYFLFVRIEQVLTSEVANVSSDFKWDPRGYVFYCPCMGECFNTAVSDVGIRICNILSILYFRNICLSTFA